MKKENEKNCNLYTTIKSLDSNLGYLLCKDKEKILKEK